MQICSETEVYYHSCVRMCVCGIELDDKWLSTEPAIMRIPHQFSEVGKILTFMYLKY